MKRIAFFLVPFLLLFQLSSAQLTGFVPNQGAPGQTLQTTITGNNIFIQTSSPTGNLYEIKLIQGPNVITIFDFNNVWMYWGLVNVVDPNTVTAELYVPLGAAPGVYDLQVITGDPWYPYWNQTTYTLPGAFTIAPPDGVISGTVYNDLNRNGVQDAGEPPIANRTVQIMPGNINLSTNASGYFSQGVMNGNYSVILLNYWSDQMFVTTLNDTLSVTINSANSPNNNFGLKNALISVTPDIGYKGVTTTHQLVADEPIFATGANPWGNVSQVYINSTPSITVSNAAITVIDSYTIQVVIPIPVATSVAINRDIRVYTTTGAYAGYHYLRQKFAIATAPAYISGTAFYDTNLNKVFDAGEPGIEGAKFKLEPDSTYAFSNQAGGFSFTSPGGIQILTYENNLPGLTLFTDSSSYTFNAIGNITGKNFGFISNLADYSITVKCLALFPRCNSDQYVMFFVRNTGDITYNARAWLKMDPLMTFVSSPLPTTVSNDTVYWNLTNLEPHEMVFLLAKVTLPGAGNILDLTVGASSLDAGNNVQLTDTRSKSFGIFCAWDPNDKQVAPIGVMTEHFTLMNETLDYLVRFQNTGNDTALKVVVMDTLDSNLDYNTVEIIGSSHSVQTQLRKNGELQFVFNNIMLVDSNANEPMSHGFVNYTVKPKLTLPDSTEVYNAAHIFFDFNPVVATNTTFNTLVYALPGGPLPVELVSFTGKAGEYYNDLSWVTMSELNNDHFELERSLNGHEFTTIANIEGNGTTNNPSEYKFRDLEIENRGYYYRLRQVDYDGASHLSEIIYVNRTDKGTGFILSVIPNPFKEQFTIIFDGSSNEPVQMELFDVMGKSVYKERQEAGGLFITVDFSNHSVSSGAYILKVISGDRLQTFRMFKN